MKWSQVYNPPKKTITSELVSKAIAKERKRCAKIAEQTETWTQHIEETDHNDLYTGTYKMVERTTPKWRDGKAIAAAIRNRQ